MAVVLQNRSKARGDQTARRKLFACQVMKATQANAARESMTGKEADIFPRAAHRFDVQEKPGLILVKLTRHGLC